MHEHTMIRMNFAWFCWGAPNTIYNIMVNDQKAQCKQIISCCEVLAHQAPNHSPQWLSTTVRISSDERKPLALDGGQWIGHTIKNSPFTSHYCILMNTQPQIFLHLCDLSGRMKSRRKRTHNPKMNPNSSAIYSWVRMKFHSVLKTQQIF